MRSSINLKRGIVPLSKFRQASKKYLAAIGQSHEAIVLTQNGLSAAVVLTPQDYERLQYERDLFQAIAQGEEDLAKGKTVCHRDVFDELLS